MARQRIVLGIMGGEGSGKSDVAFTAPQPILAIGCDPNVEDIACKVFDADTCDDLDPGQCRLVMLPYPAVGFETDEDAIAREATEAWDVMTDALAEVIRKRAKVQPRTVVLDSGTLIDKLNVLAEFGRTDKISPQVRRIKMGNLNARFMGLFRGLEQAGCHVIVTHQCRPKWETQEVRGRNGIEEKDVQVPGEFERVGFKQMGYILNTEILTLFDPAREGKLAGKFGMRVLRSMARPAVVGREYWGKTEEGVRQAGFPYLATLLYPHTTLKDWE